MTREVKDAVLIDFVLALWMHSSVWVPQTEPAQPTESGHPERPNELTHFSPVDWYPISVQLIGIHMYWYSGRQL